MKWLIDMCRESNMFSWLIAIGGIILMLLIALILVTDRIGQTSK